MWVRNDIDNSHDELHHLQLIRGEYVQAKRERRLADPGKTVAHIGMGNESRAPSPQNLVVGLMSA
jgi:hypothetical protein